MTLQTSFRAVDGRLEIDGRPLVVVDRCVMLQRIERYVPDQFQIVLPDVFFHEAAGADPLTEGAIFDRWAVNHSDRIWMGKIWTDVSSVETDPGRLVSQQDIIHEPLTTQFRFSLSTGGLNWNNCVRASDADERLSVFVDTCRKFSDWAHQQSSTWCSDLQSQASRHAWIRDPGLVAEFVRQYNPRFEDAAWNDILSSFPDRLAVARMARLVAWYALCYSLHKTRGFGNNWEDAEYAFAASYVGRLATVDRGLAETVRAVFPGVEVIDAPIP